MYTSPNHAYRFWRRNHAPQHTAANGTHGGVSAFPTVRAAMRADRTIPGADARDGITLAAACRHKAACYAATPSTRGGRRRLHVLAEILAEGGGVPAVSPLPPTQGPALCCRAATSHSARRRPGPRWFAQGPGPGRPGLRGRKCRKRNLLGWHRRRSSVCSLPCNACRTIPTCPSRPSPQPEAQEFF